MAYIVKIAGWIPVSEFDSAIGLYTSRNISKLNKNLFDLDKDSNTKKITKVGVYGGRFIDSYSYEMDISELVTDLNFEINDFFTTKKSSNVTISIKNLEDMKSTSNNSLKDTQEKDFLYNIFLRVGATISITQVDMIETESSVREVQYDGSSFRGRIEELGINEDTIEIKAFDAIKELEDIECPLTIYSDLWKLKYPKEEDRIKAIKTKKLNITLVDACTYINNLLGKKYLDNTVNKIVFDEINKKSVENALGDINSAMSNLNSTYNEIIKIEHPFKDDKYAFTVLLSDCDKKTLAEFLSISMDKFYTQFLLLNKLDAESANSSNAVNHMIPTITPVKSNAPLSYNHNILALTDIPTLNSGTSNTNTKVFPLEIDENKWTAFNISNSASSIKNLFNFEKRTVLKDADGKEKKEILESLPSFPSLSKGDYENSDVMKSYLNSQVKYGIKSKNFILTKNDLVEPLTLAKGLCFYNEQSTKIKLSFTGPVFGEGSLSDNYLNRIITYNLIHINKYPFQNMWMSIVTVSKKISNGTMTIDLGVIPCMEYEYKQPVIVNAMPPKSVEYSV